MKNGVTYDHEGCAPGAVYMTPDGELWKVIAYAHEPTVTLKRVDSDERRDGVVGCRLLDDFVRMLPIDYDQALRKRVHA